MYVAIGMFLVQVGSFRYVVVTGKSSVTDILLLNVGRVL